MGTTPRNEGEGNKSADRNYREATQKFVESERGRRAIDEAGEVSASEEEEIRRAEMHMFSRGFLDEVGTKV